MRVAAFVAGVSGQLWLLIDDLLATNSCAIRLGELLSDPFSLSLGTAQGRRLSVHLFNGIMAFLKRFLEEHSRGVGVWTSGVPRQVVQRVSAQSPTPFGEYRASDVLQGGFRLVGGLQNDEAAIHVLASMEGSVKRLAVVDEAAPFRVMALQYVDDRMAPASSTAHVAELCRAATNFSCTHGGTFNVGPSKSAALPIGATWYDAEDPGVAIKGVRVGRVEAYHYLGVLVDRWLSFAPQLQHLLKRGRTAFAEFAGAAESLQLPFPLQAAAVMQKVAGNVLYGIDILSRRRPRS